MEQIRRELMNRMGDVLKAIRLFKSSPGQHAMGTLAALDRTRATSVTQLATQCALDPSTVSRAVTALVKDGLVERTADPADGRAGVLSISPHGREVLEATIRTYDARLAHALRDWSADDLRTLTALLKRFSEDLETL
ncbi:MarR family winged helix-turn-helix transcriptional regulator [Actinoplanes sp. NPDC049265]|uniref:MarR family winged helix-turn-helix transcriptional regulator n=1 Tax=Actinoplanes sp. NPDC049265 TaxID=3363902 RepID=UPI0037113F2C